MKEGYTVYCLLYARRKITLKLQRSTAPPKHPEPSQRGAFGKIYQRVFSTKRPKQEGDEEAPQAPLFTAEPSETSNLLGNRVQESSRMHHERLNQQWEAAVAAG